MHVHNAHIDLGKTMPIAVEAYGEWVRKCHVSSDEPNPNPINFDVNPPTQANQVEVTRHLSLYITCVYPFLPDNPDMKEIAECFAQAGRGIPAFDMRGYEYAEWLDSLAEEFQSHDIWVNDNGNAEYFLYSPSNAEGKE